MRAFYCAWAAGLPCQDEALTNLQGDLVLRSALSKCMSNETRTSTKQVQKPSIAYQKFLAATWKVYLKNENRVIILKESKYSCKPIRINWIIISNYNSDLIASCVVGIYLPRVYSNYPQVVYTYISFFSITVSFERY